MYFLTIVQISWIQHHGSEDLKAFVTQFEFILPEEKRQIIRDVIEQIEVSGGIEDETQGQAILNNLIKGLGL